MKYEFRISHDEPVLIFIEGNTKAFMVLDRQSKDRLIINNRLFLIRYKHQILSLEKQMINDYKDNENDIKEFLKRIEKY